MTSGVEVRPDQVSVGVLVTSVPRDTGAVAQCGVAAKRSDGKLPPHVTVYLTMGLWLFPADDYAEVAAKVTGALDRSVRVLGWVVDGADFGWDQSGPAAVGP